MISLRPDPQSLGSRIPASSTPEYFAARQSLLDAELALAEQVEKVAAQRRALPPGIVLGEYTLTDASNHDNDDAKVSLKDLFGDADTLVLYSYMYAADADAPCPHCTAGLPSLNAFSAQLNARPNVSFAVIAAAQPAKLRAVAEKYNLADLRFVSSFGSAFKRDMGWEAPEQVPGYMVFRKDAEGRVRHFYTQTPVLGEGNLRGVDAMVPLFNVLDLTPDGRGNFPP